MNPINQTKQAISNPKESVKQTALGVFDPAGYVARAGTNRLDEGFNARYIAGSAGGVAANPVIKPAAPAPNSYQSPAPLQLSAGAQQLLADMQARMAARNAGATYQAGTRAAPAPAMSGAPGPVGQPRVGIGMVRQPGATGFADGGKVGGRRAKKAPLAGCEHFESKRFDRKPNGKKC